MNDVSVPGCATSSCACRGAVEFFDLRDESMPHVGLGLALVGGYEPEELAVLCSNGHQRADAQGAADLRKSGEVVM